MGQDSSKLALLARCMLGIISLLPCLGDLDASAILNFTGASCRVHAYAKSHTEESSAMRISVFSLNSLKQKTNSTIFAAIKLA